MRKNLVIFVLALSLIMCGCGNSTESNNQEESKSSVESHAVEENSTEIESAEESSETEDYGKTIKEESFWYDTDYMHIRCAEKSDGIHYYAYISALDPAKASNVAVLLQNDGLIEKGIECSVVTGKYLITRDYVFDSQSKEYNYDRAEWLAEQSLTGNYESVQEFTDQVTKDFFGFIEE